MPMALRRSTRNCRLLVVPGLERPWSWWSLFAVLPSGQGEEHGLQAGLELTRVADSEPGGRSGGDELTEHAVRLAREDPDGGVVRFHLADPGAARQPGPVRQGRRGRV